MGHEFHIDGPNNVGITVKTPCDLESDPKLIEDTHRFEVRRLIQKGILDPARISYLLCLPAWNVERAIHWITHGVPLPPPAKRSTPARHARGRQQNPIAAEKDKYKRRTPKVPNERMKQLRGGRVKNGLCRLCGKSPPLEGIQKCGPCRDKLCLYFKDYRKRRKKSV